MKPVTSKQIIQVFIIVALFGIMASMCSCSAPRVCGSTKMIGYADGNDAKKVIKNNR